MKKVRQILRGMIFMTKAKVALAIGALVVLLFSSAATASATAAPTMTDDNPCCARP